MEPVYLALSDILKNAEEKITEITDDKEKFGKIYEFWLQDMVLRMRDSCKMTSDELLYYGDRENTMVVF